MSDITIRNFNEETEKRLRLMAARHGHSLEEEVRRILNRAVIESEETGLGTFINNQFKEIGGVELEIPSRSQNKKARLEELMAIGRQCADHIQKPASAVNHGDLLYDDEGLPG